MKFLVVVSALIAVAAAFPSELTRAKRGVFGFGGYGGDFGGYGGHGAFGGYGGYGAYGGYDGLGAVVKGPSGVIAANTGAVHGFGAGHAVVSGPAAGHAVVSGPAAGHAVVAGPAPVHAAVVAPAGAHGYAGAGHHGAASISSAPQVAGVVNSPSATLIGPSTDGHPGAIIPKGYTGVYGYGHGHGHGAGAHGGYWG